MTMNSTTEAAIACRCPSKAELDLLRANHADLNEQIGRCALCAFLLNEVTGDGNLRQDLSGCWGDTDRTMSFEIGIGSRIEHYVITAELGRGTQGVVYEARSRGDGEKVAIKLMLSTDLRARMRFEREIAILGLCSHQNIARLITYGELDHSAENRLYIVQEYVYGQDIVTFCRTKRLKPKDSLVIFRRLLRGVACAHGHGIVHRDLNPSNVLMGRDAQPKIIDFGIAQHHDKGTSQLTGVGQILGTLPYMAPEQFRADHDLIGPATDVYALGVILYQLITGSVPFDLSGKPFAEAARIIDSWPVPPIRRSSPKELSRIERVVMQALEKRPENRFPSASALDDALFGDNPLARVKSHRVMSAAIPEAVKPGKRTPNHLRWIAAAFGLGLIGGMLMMAGWA